MLSTFIILTQKYRTDRPSFDTNPRLYVPSRGGKSLNLRIESFEKEILIKKDKNKT
eukprot:c31369_g1_i1 orf=147-314(+)